MKGKNVSAKQKKYHDSLCQLIGCIACHAEGNFNTHVAIHHCDGRTKPMAHWKTLPLCGPHHQCQGIPDVIAVHPYKHRFETRYGSQEDLIEKCAQLLADQGVELPDEIKELTGVTA